MLQLPSTWSITVTKDGTYDWNLYKKNPKCIIKNACLLTSAYCAGQFAFSIPMHSLQFVAAATWSTTCPTPIKQTSMYHYHWSLQLSIFLQWKIIFICKFTHNFCTFNYKNLLSYRKTWVYHCHKLQICYYQTTTGIHYTVCITNRTRSVVADNCNRGS